MKAKNIFCTLHATFGSVQVLQPPQSHTASSATEVTYHMYLASLGQLSYTPSVELVVGWTICETCLKFCHLSIMSCSC